MASLQEVYHLFLKSSGVQTDSRKVVQNQLFFALTGPNFDGNAYAQDALNKGALAAIVDRKDIAKARKNCMLVDDVLETLQALAKHHRKQFDIPIIALTGSNGKTTTKELIHTVLGSKHQVLATKGNLNNHIGVPLTLLGLTSKHSYALIEMGANHLKEIAFLCDITQPTHGLITNVGKAHLEGFGSEAGVLQGKTELYRHIEKNDGVLFVNKEDEKLTNALGTAKAIYYHPREFDVIEEQPMLTLMHKSIKINTQLVGKYNTSNVAAALCIGKHFDVLLKQSANAIKTYTPKNNRSQLLKQNNKTIVLDAYNANPSSMYAALTAFSQQQGTKALLLGHMAELGAHEADEHEKIVRLANDLGFDECYWVGKGYKPFVTTNWFATTAKMKAHLEVNKITAEHILVKGSRSTGLEVLTTVL